MTGSELLRGACPRVQRRARNDDLIISWMPAFAGMTNKMDQKLSTNQLTSIGLASVPDSQVTLAVDALSLVKCIKISINMGPVLAVLVAAK